MKTLDDLEAEEVDVIDVDSGASEAEIDAVDVPVVVTSEGSICVLFELAMAGSVLFLSVVPGLTSSRPPEPKVITCPDVVIPGPFGESVVPSTTTPVFVPVGAEAVSVKLPATRVLVQGCGSDAREGRGISVKAAVCDPWRTRPSEPWLMTCPLIVAAGPPAEMAIPSKAMASGSWGI